MKKYCSEMRESPQYSFASSQCTTQAQKIKETAQLVKSLLQLFCSFFAGNCPIIFDFPYSCYNEKIQNSKQLLSKRGLRS